MTQQSPAAKRYAEALADALEDSAPSRRLLLREKLEAFRDLMADSFDVRNVLLNPSVTAADRATVLAELMEKMDAEPELRKFLALVSERGRMAELADIVDAYGAVDDARRGLLRAQVVSAVELSADSIEQIRHALQRRLDRQIELDVQVDPAVIGGVRTTVGSLVFDGTIATELARLRERLEAAGA